MKARLWTLTFLFTFLFSGCGSLSLDAQYIKADRKTYDVVAPITRQYIEEDEALPEVRKDALILLLDSWLERIISAEKNMEDSNG